MSKRTNEELMALHWAGKPHPKSDDARLCRLIQAHYANELVRRLERAAASTSDPVTRRDLSEIASMVSSQGRGTP